MGAWQLHYTPAKRARLGGARDVRCRRNLLLAGMLAALSTGCTRIVVHEGDGKVRTENGIGIVRLTTQPGRQPQIIQSQGLGIIARDGATTIGYFSSDMAVLPRDDCRIVIWLEEDTVPELLDEIMARGEAICPVGPGAQPEERR